MKIAIQVRQDHATKPGGDTAIANAFAHRLQHKGHTTSLVSDSDSLSILCPDILIAFNLDLPLQLLELCRAAKNGNARVALYALHHPRAGIKAYLEGHLSGIRAIFAKLSMYDPDKYLYAKSIALSTRKLNTISVRNALKSRETTMREISGLIDDLMVSGSSEAAEIEQSTGAFKNVRNWSISHPLNIESITIEKRYKKGKSKGRHFLIAGRIESRKNQLSVLKTSKHFPDDEFIFAGLMNETDAQYAAEFSALLAKRPNCKWIGQIDLSALINLIANVDAVISPSWFEVMSLINLFAYAVGTPIISSSYTYDADVIGSDAIRYRPDIENGLSSALIRFVPNDVVRLTVEEIHQRVAYLCASTWAGFDAWTAYVEAKFGAQR